MDVLIDAEALEQSELEDLETILGHDDEYS